MKLQIDRENLQKAYEEGCEEVNATLKLLFPEEFNEPDFDFQHFWDNPFEYVEVRGSSKIIIQTELLEGFEREENPIPGEFYPYVDVKRLAELFLWFKENTPLVNVGVKEAQHDHV